MLSWHTIRDQIRKVSTYEEKSVAVSLVIEHPLLREAFSATLTSLDHHVRSTHRKGRELVASLLAGELPQIVLIDVLRTGALETTAWLREHHTSVKVLILCSSGILS